MWRKDVIPLPPAREGSTAYDRENIGGECTLRRRCVRVSRDSGAALVTRDLIGRHPEMDNHAAAFALCLCGY